MGKGENNSSVDERVKLWLEGNFDEKTKEEVRKLLKNPAELNESFYRDLEFGTGGLRGIMGVGTNRMNIYTVGMATQGLCNYLKQQFSKLPEIKVAIAHDSRNNSKLFAETAAKILSANGIKVFLFDSLRPTPELSFTVRYLKCQSGIVITASHNPKEYNGYKVYWDDGGQIIAPHDKNIIEEVKKIKNIDQVRLDGNKDKIEIIGEEIDEIYTDKIKTLSISPELIKKNNDLKIVYTPLHGSGVKLIPKILEKFGFRNVIHVPQQDVTDGNFPTVKSPNPEEHAALDLALEKAKETDADLVLASDPDADRVGVAVKNKDGQFVLLNGNQTATLLINYLISCRASKKILNGNQYIVKTIVTTDLIADIAKKYKVEYFDVLTGFKYIADTIQQNEKENKDFIGGGEESYGFLAADFVRDKDAVMTCALVAETAAWARENGKTLWDVLVDIYVEYGFYKESLISIVRQGKSGAEEIQKMMERFRNNPPSFINNSEVMLINDYLKHLSYGKLSTPNDITLPVSNVLQFFLKDGSKISIRPSGTEPKIKFYFSVKEKLANKDDFQKVDDLLAERIKNIIADLKIS
ncbi:MAG: phospho-sugar mutase [Bacteroidota bacterium]|nr:phospho-sugar mutase [Bacteroidota bacterium]